ncbi:MAG: DUF3098 domain-containing protein [Bacteroidales bacterium]
MNTRKTTSKGKHTSPEKPQAPERSTFTFAFGRANYKLLFIGLALIVVGFLLMIGGGSDDPNVFSDKIFSFRRMTLAPILILAGYVVEIFAIMKKPRD